MHLKPNIVFLLLVVTAFDAIDGSPVCGSSACQKIKCLPSDQVRKECVARKGIINERSGWCSCCTTCLKRLYEDQDCSVILNLQLPARAECTEGLQCSPITKRCFRLKNDTTTTVTPKVLK